MKLRAKVSASAFDEHYQMAFVYCLDQETNYCFSLSRFPGECEIEIMVSDQRVCRVDNVEATYLDGRLRVALGDAVASELDGHSEYDIEIDLTDMDEKNIREALLTIFAGKSGLVI